MGMLGRRERHVRLPTDSDLVHMWERKQRRARMLALTLMVLGLLAIVTLLLMGAC